VEAFISDDFASGWESRTAMANVQDELTLLTLYLRKFQPVLDGVIRMKAYVRDRLYVLRFLCLKSESARR